MYVHCLQCGLYYFNTLPFSFFPSFLLSYHYILPKLLQLYFGFFDCFFSCSLIHYNKFGHDFPLLTSSIKIRYICNFFVRKGKIVFLISSFFFLKKSLVPLEYGLLWNEMNSSVLGLHLQEVCGKITKPGRRPSYVAGRTVKYKVSITFFFSSLCVLYECVCVYNSYVSLYTFSFLQSLTFYSIMIHQQTT